MNIKHLTLAITAAAAWALMPAQAQPIASGESAITYSLPRNTIRIDIQVSQVEETPGIFYQYSERYLGTKDVVTERRTHYELESVSINLNAAPDPDKTYKLEPTADCIIHTDSRGLLRAINAMPDKKVAPKGKDEKKGAPSGWRSLMPLGEEQMMASSTAKMAESTAKQIYRIREARMSLISGDMDNMPADGESLRLMLRELDRQERQLCELFIGTRRRTTRTEHLEVNPMTDVNNEILFRFSSHDGVVDKDDLSGEPIRWTMQVSKRTYDNTQKARKPQGRICVNLPGSAEISISRDGRQLARRTLRIAQFGITTPVSDKLIMSGARIWLDAKTGSIVKIEK